MMRLGTAITASTIIRSSQPAGRETRPLLTVRGAVARRRDPFGLRGQSVPPVPLAAIFVNPPIGVRRHRADAAEPVDLWRGTNLVERMTRVVGQRGRAPAQNVDVDHPAEPPRFRGYALRQGGQTALRNAPPRALSAGGRLAQLDRKSTRLNSSHVAISY